VSAWCAQCVAGVEMVRSSNHISGCSARMRYSGAVPRPGVVRAQEDRQLDHQVRRVDRAEAKVLGSW
jgi:hypothetical protein